MTKFEIVSDEFREHPNHDIKLPTRATKNSAGYDFYTPVDLVVYPGKCTFIKLDVKAKMDSDQVLLMYIRSSVGIKHNVLLANGTGVIDSDFYGNPDNDGNMTLALYNYGSDVQIFYAGERIAQGVFVKYCTTDDDIADGIRQGGIGSTDKIPGFQGNSSVRDISASGFKGGKVPPNRQYAFRDMAELIQEMHKENENKQ